MRTPPIAAQEWGVAFPPADFDASATTASALVERFAPQFSHLPLGERFEGWDNVTYRLGVTHGLRLPRLRGAVPLLEIEQRWLPGLKLPVAVPVPVVCGHASDVYPAPWSIFEWIDGVDASVEALGADGRRDLGAALAALHVPAPAQAPVCEWRATPLAARAEEFASRVDEAPASIDKDLLRDVYSQGAVLQAELMASGPAVWIHADIHALNLVVRGGRLVGLIDWGEMSAGDRLVDLGQVWVLVGEEALGDVLDSYGARLGPDEWVVLRAHTADAALRLSGSGNPAHSQRGWRALAELGVLAAR